jgi:hypothetical protein
MSGFSGNREKSHGDPGVTGGLDSSFLGFHALPSAHDPSGWFRNMVSIGNRN